MGFCSGTDIFDDVMVELVKKKIDRNKIIKALIVALENHDWDCQGESQYWSNPHVRRARKELGQ